METVLLAQAAALLATAATALLRLCLALPCALLSLVWQRATGRAQAQAGVEWYEGTVMHARTKPAENKFRGAGVE